MAVWLIVFSLLVAIVVAAIKAGQAKVAREDQKRKEHEQYLFSQIEELRNALEQGKDDVVRSYARKYLQTIHSEYAVCVGRSSLHLRAMFQSEKAMP